MSDFIFYHIPKCGGTSLRKMLYDYFSEIYPKNIIFIPEKSGDISLNYRPQFIDKIKKNPNFDFPNIKIILSHTYYGDFPDLYNRCKFKFTCVRNPIQRTISHYIFFDFPKNKIKLNELNPIDFHNFCSKIGNVMSALLGISSNFTINDIDNRLKEFDYIAVLENLENDLLILNELLNSKFNVKNHLTSTILNKNDKIQKDENIINLIKPYCSLDELVYNRTIYLKKNGIIK